MDQALGDGQEMLANSIVDHVTHGTGALEGFNAGSLMKNSQYTLNPCIRHPLNEI